MDESGGWRFAQAFGDKGDIEEITEADVISAVEFDSTGNFLATGDKGGRVVLFERNHTKKPRGVEYKFMTEFQSHEPEFDYLKSLEIEEKINQIRWCGRGNAAHFLLSTNDKTIKLWKVFEKTLRMVSVTNHYDGARALPTPTSRANLRLPRTTQADRMIAAVPRKIYANAHAYHIHSVSVNSDMETYLSADDLRINLWNLGVHDQSFNIVDIKPNNMEELTEVITSASFHPTHCNLFLYASSKAVLRLADMRAAALSDPSPLSSATKRFEETPDPSSTSFFSEIIGSISDARFSPDGMRILARDYLSLKVWDVRNEARPLRTVPVHDHLRGKLLDLYENDCIFDKWEAAWAHDGRRVVSGSYGNFFRVVDVDNEESAQDVVLQADKSVLRAVRARGAAGAGAPGANADAAAGGRRDLRAAMGAAVDPTDFNKKILHASWHPREATVAIAATNSLFIYTAA
ncbi:Protein phosphatase PP2A regulatory subunit B [Mycena chlorophos]|uniref:Protein phosphatase PP2A regulatory subunit B n=1 Tax=Mycena chlorophos TaxID=658473 RepID=A0A8H6VZV5_MYCCL|nr:Protein phosphatase PP2A regulatory subunit B [Mycena chlorophos]